MQPAFIYDPRYHTWESWCALMGEAFAAQQLGIGASEENWKSWATGLKGIDIFSNESIPLPDTFDDWQDWAAALMNAVNFRN